MSFSRQIGPEKARGRLELLFYDRLSHFPSTLSISSNESLDGGVLEIWTEAYNGDDVQWLSRDVA